jgi:hypothetical protein
VFVALALVAIGGLAAGVWHTRSTPEPGGPLTGAEIRTLVSGNTIKGAKFSEYYAPDGSIRGREIEDEDEEYQGTWHIDGDRLCVAFPSHDFTACSAITPEHDNEYDFTSSEQHAKRTVIAGNPNKL